VIAKTKGVSMKKILFAITLFSVFLCTIPADDLADLLQD